MRRPLTLTRRSDGSFFAREQPDRLAGLFRDYQSWLTTQVWYQFETAEPDQVN